jgi:sortase B
MKDLKSKKKIILFVILILIVCTGYVTNKQFEDKKNEIFKEFILNDTNIDYDSLIVQDSFDTKTYVSNLKNKYKNNDVVGALNIENANYTVPLVQGKDNDYYLNHLPNKKSSFMGSVYLDYRVDVDNSKKLLIFGHNSSKYYMPFKVLMNYYNEDYVKSHEYLTITTENKIRRYKIFAVLTETSNFDYMKLVYRNNDYKKHLDYLYNKSIFKLDDNYNIDSNIVILQTCSTHKKYKKYNKKFLLVVFKEVK